MILPDLTKYYLNVKKGSSIVISLEETEEVYSNVIPLFVGMLDMLYTKSGRPVYIELSYNPRLLAFLKHINFFELLLDLNIIDFEHGYINDLPHYNYLTNDKIQLYNPMPYSEESPDKQKIRDILAFNIRSNLISSYIFNRRTSPIKSDQLWDIAIIASTELIVNAILYSNSRCYVYTQSNISFNNNKKGFLLAIVDIGQGFLGSLNKKNEYQNSYYQTIRCPINKYAQKLGINIENNQNFLLIMEALYYSQNQEREIDLYKLKNILAVSGANLRIHYKDTEIIFTSTKCGKCQNKNILQCMECVWNGRHSDFSSLKKNPIVFKGVHIEVEFIQEEYNV